MEEFIRFGNWVYRRKGKGDDFKFAPGEMVILKGKGVRRGTGLMGKSTSVLF